MTRCAHTLSIPSQTSQLARVRKCVMAWSEEAGLTDDAAAALQMAVDEACANTIEHAYAGRPNEKVKITATLRKDALVVTIRHTGAPFDPKLHQRTALKDMRKQRRPHGYGLHLMHRLVDEIDFVAKGKASEVRLTKLRNGDRHA